MLMSFVGCIGIDGKHWSRGGIESCIWRGSSHADPKNLPQNIRALQMLCEELLGISYKTQTHLLICCSCWREGWFKIGQPSFGLIVLSNQF